MITPEIIKEQLNSAIQEAVEQYHEDHLDSKAFSRSRILDMPTMIKLLLSMHGGSLNKELHEMGIDVTVSAFSQQRKKLSAWELENVFDNFNRLCTDEKRYKGYQILAIDGTVVNMPRNPKAETFVCHKGAPKGYNQFHVNSLYDILNKTYLHCVIQPQPRQDEVGALKFMLDFYDFAEKTLIIADRGYESYNIFANFFERNVDFLIRVKQERTAMREVAKLPMEELDVDINFTLATSLPKSFSLEEIKELYHWRWGIETAFRELKYGLGLTHLHGKSDDFVQQEIFASMIMANFCSRISALAIIKQKSDNTYTYAINWKMAIQLCKEFYRDENGDGKKLLKNICKYTEPIRLGRKDERNIKAKSFVGFVYRVSS